LFPAKSTQSGGSLVSSSGIHSVPAPSPDGHCTTVRITGMAVFSCLYGFISDFLLCFQINIDHPKKTVELLLPVDITTVRIRFYPRNDGTGSLASQVWK
jgi:hypothetical protein